MQVTSVVWMSLKEVDRNHTAVMVIIMLLAMVHFVFSLMILLGTKLCKRTLLIPWMISHMISIIIMIITFTCWTFMSFFIDILVAIVFPVVSGLVLGLWIVMWRQVYNFFTILKERDRQVFINIEMQEETKNIFLFT